MTIWTEEEKDYPAGARTFAFPGNVSKKNSAINVVMTRVGWPKLLTLTIQFERSTNGFATWDVLLATNAVGGNLVGPFGVTLKQVIGYSIYGINLKQPIDFDGDVRVRITNSGSYRTEIELETLAKGDRGQRR